MEKKEEIKQQAINGKKNYNSPSLTIHGNIVSLTGAGGKVTKDGKGTKSVT
jgi:hypothetical protein